MKDSPQNTALPFLDSYVTHGQGVSCDTVIEMDLHEVWAPSLIRLLPRKEGAYSAVLAGTGEDV